ncbi:phosphatases II, partial [Trichodelitschia bisporula]
MANILRQIVAGPRSRHPEANLDLCYVTDTIIATSGPSSTYPRLAYRNPLNELIKFLDTKHGPANWCIWEFRAEGTGYPDDAVRGRIWHFPWPDHHPPPFALVPRIVASMREWVKGGPGGGEAGPGPRVVVVHCKAGKGRSGTASCAYLLSEEGWSVQDAIKRFTERRMRPGWGEGVSIPSQLRWLTYVDRWVNGGKVYVEREVEVVEVQVWGLRDGAKLAIRGFRDEGKVIETVHEFTKDERRVTRGEVKSFGFANAVFQLISGGNGGSGRASPAPSTSSRKAKKKKGSTDSLPTDKDGSKDTASGTSREASPDANDDDDTTDATFIPSTPIILKSSDVNLSVERRAKGPASWNVVTSVAHVWFNTYFEGQGPERRMAAQAAGKGEGAEPGTDSPPNTSPEADAESSGIFHITWDKMDGIKGSSRKGVRAFDRVAVVWRVRPSREVIPEPKAGEKVQQAQAADWKGAGEAETEGDEEGVQA